MIISRPTVGELISVVGGAALIAVMFASWYGAGVSVQRSGFTISATTGIDAWQAFSVIDVVLVVIALGAIVLPILRVVGVLATSVTIVGVAAIGLIAAGLVLYRIISAPDLASQVPEVIKSGLPLQVTRRVGIFLGLASSLLMVLGALAMVGPSREGRGPETSSTE